MACPLQRQWQRRVFERIDFMYSNETLNVGTNDNGNSVVIKRVLHPIVTTMVLNGTKMQIHFVLKMYLMNNVALPVGMVT